MKKVLLFAASLFFVAGLASCNQPATEGEAETIHEHTHEHDGAGHTHEHTHDGDTTEHEH